MGHQTRVLRVDDEDASELDDEELAADLCEDRDRLFLTADLVTGFSSPRLLALEGAWAEVAEVVSGAAGFSQPDLRLLMLRVFFALVCTCSPEFGFLFFFLARPYTSDTSLSSRVM